MAAELFVEYPPRLYFSQFDRASRAAKARIAFRRMFEKFWFARRKLVLFRYGIALILHLNSRSIVRISNSRRCWLHEFIGLLAPLQILIATAAIAEVKAGTPVDASQVTRGQVVVNAGGSPLVFLNIAHALTLQSTQVGWPGILTDDGYPTG